MLSSKSISWCIVFAYALVDSLLNALHLRQKVGNRGPLKDTLRGLWTGLTIPITNPLEKENDPTKFLDHWRC